MIRPDIRIASPCSTDWNKMQGDDRVRHCADCNLNVYNFAAMTDLEVERLIAKTQGRLCARIYRRADGTILTQNCPVGLRARIKKISRIASAALSAAMSVTFAVAQTKTPQKPAVVQPEGQASLKITATDVSGSLIPNTEVDLENVSTHQKLSNVTNEEGVLVFPRVAPGEYKLNAKAPGFIYSGENLVLRSGETKKMNVVLDISDAPQMGVVAYPIAVEVELETSDIPSKITN